jgi:hypothetical protein
MVQPPNSMPDIIDVLYRKRKKLSFHIFLPIHHKKLKAATVFDIISEEFPHPSKPKGCISQTST